MEHELECYRPKRVAAYIIVIRPADFETNLFLACVGIIYEGADFPTQRIRGYYY